MIRNSSLFSTRDTFWIFNKIAGQALEERRDLRPSQDKTSAARAGRGGALGRHRERQPGRREGEVDGGRARQSNRRRGVRRAQKACPEAGTLSRRTPFRSPSWMTRRAKRTGAGGSFVRVFVSAPGSGPVCDINMMITKNKTKATRGSLPGGGRGGRPTAGRGPWPRAGASRRPRPSARRA